ncbi:hypothetical protein GGF32_006347 [Allomyces javanicus]|nr:hypothetical protein GGF32_006347 [Allomyces javanicus]
MVYKLAKTAFGLEWFSGKASQGSIGPQAHVLSQLQDTEVLIKRLVSNGTNPSGNSKECHQYAKCTPEKFVKLLAKNRRVLELIHPDRLSKVFFDIDDKLGVLSLDKCKAVILEHFPGANMHICRYQTPDKSSWHIVLSNYTATLAGFPRLKSFAAAHESLGFDPTVYTENRFAMCINQSKPGETPRVYIEGSKTFTKHLIQVDFDDVVTPVSTVVFPELDATIPKGLESLHPDLLLDIPQFDPAMCDPDFFFYDAKPIDVLRIIPLSATQPISRNVIWRIMVWVKHRGLTFDEFMAWNAQKGDSNDRIARYYGYWVNADKHKVPNEFMETLFAKALPDALKSKALTNFNASMHVQATYTSKSQYLTANDIRNVKLNVLATGMGSNKTGAVCEYLLQFPGARIVWITPRITLAHNTEGRLAEDALGFVNYKNIRDKKTLDTHPRLIVSPCSLHYIKTPYDILVMDESKTCLAMYLDNTLHKTKAGDKLVANLLAIKVLATHAQCIFMDAFVLGMTMDFVRLIEHTPTIEGQLTGNSVRFVKNTLAADFVPCKMLYVHDKPKQLADVTFHANIVNDLRNGKKLYIFLLCKSTNKGIWAVQNYAECIAATMGWSIGKEIKAYHGDRPVHENKELVNPDAVWGSDEVRIVIANTKITVGVNFSAHDVFHRVYARYESWVNPCDFFQAVYRIRHPIENEIVVRLVPFKKSSIVRGTQSLAVAQIHDMHAAIIKNANLENDVQALTPHYVVFELFRKLSNIVIGDCPDYFYAVDPVIGRMSLSGWSFSWDNIEDMDVDRFHAYADGVLENPTWVEWLQVRKRHHQCKYGPQLDKAAMKMIWDGNHDKLMDLIKYFYETDTDHVLHALFAHNSINPRVPGSAFNVRATIPVSLQGRIGDDYCQLELLQHCDTTMLRKLVNAYFEKKLVDYRSKMRQVMIKGERYPNVGWTNLVKLFPLYVQWVSTAAPMDVDQI